MGKSNPNSPRTNKRRNSSSKSSKPGSKGSSRPKGEDEVTDNGIVPIFLATKTQELFNCLVDDQVTEQNPFKLISKQSALNDLYNRAAVSDFHPVKQIVANYPADEFLVVFDPKFEHGQNFYICINEEAKSRHLHKKTHVESDEEETVEEEVFEFKEPETKEWISYGSHVEIDEEKITQNRKLIKFRASRVRKEFCQPFHFEDREANVDDQGTMTSSYVGCKSYQDSTFSLHRVEIDRFVQAIPETTQNSSQTIWRHPVSSSTQYVPRQFEEEQIEVIEDEEKYKDFLVKCCPKFEMVLQQNQITNAFVNDWKLLGEEDNEFGTKSDNHLKEYQSFTDLQYSKDKTVSCLDWHPDIKGIIAVACCERLTAYERIDKATVLGMRPSLILIWSFVDPIHPQVLLEAPDDVTCFKFCPTNPNIVAAGCINGQVVVWDVSDHSDRLTNTKQNAGNKNNTKDVMFGEEIPPDIPSVRCAAVSSIEFSHKSIITAIEWVPLHMEYNKFAHVVQNYSRECHQLVTTGVDGNIMVWDIAKPPERGNHQQTSLKPAPVTSDSPLGISKTFQHLDLKWRPLFSMNFNNGSSVFAPLCISLGEKHNVLDHVTVQGGGDHIFGLLSNKPQHKPPPPERLEGIRSKFFSGTEDGQLLYADFKPQAGDKDKGPQLLPTWEASIHDGAVNTVMRNPHFMDLILSVGGWNFNLYKEGCKTAILTSACCDKLYTSGHWSLTRSSVFFLATSNGDIEVWDLLDRTHEPIIRQNVTSSIITKVVPTQITRKQHLLAVTDNIGTLHILEIPWNLHHPSNNEHASVGEYVDREISRIDFMESKKANRAQLKKEKTNTRVNKNQSMTEVDEKDPEEILKEEYNEFKMLEKKLMIELGLWKEDSLEVLS